MKLKGIDGGPHKRRNMWFNSMIRELSSARAVRCRLKCHNERNPFRRLPSGDAGDSGGTAAARREEGGDDVKSARPLRPGPHTCYNGGHSELEQGDLLRIMKSPPSSDRSLQPDSAKPDSLVIAHQPWRGEYVPGPCTHRPSSHESLGRLNSGDARPRAIQVIGAKS